MRASVITAVLAAATAFGGEISYNLTGLGTTDSRWINVSGTDLEGQVIGGILVEPGTLVPGGSSGEAVQISLTPSNSVRLRFTTEPNKGYVVERCDSLATGAWEALLVVDPTPSGSTVVFTDPISPDVAQRFYRVRTAGTAMLKSADGLASSSVPHRARVNAFMDPLGGWSTLGNTAQDVPQSASGRALSAEEAGALARRLANDQAEGSYGIRPFQRNVPARWIAGHWAWRGRQGYGRSDLEAHVRFSANGGAPQANIILLDSQLLRFF